MHRTSQTHVVQLEQGPMLHGPASRLSSPILLQTRWLSPVATLFTVESLLGILGRGKRWLPQGELGNDSKSR
jgi:hypothetical protein